MVKWHNFAGQLDPVAMDKGLGDDFRPGGFITDRMAVNLQTRRPEDFNPHSASGYLALPEVCEVVYSATRFDRRTPFLVARDLAAALACTSSIRQSTIVTRQ